MWSYQRRLIYIPDPTHTSPQALALDGVEPTPANGAAGSYPLAKHFYALTKAEPAAAVRDFLVFLRSPAAGDILARNGHWLP